jgi:tetratricopeptide (TPR) repeat protein
MVSHLGAMLGNLALAEHRFADAATHLRRAADAAHHLGFAAAEAYHLTTLARAQEHSGEPHTAITTLERAIDAALATGDLRVAAMARVRLGRLLHARGDRHSARVAALLAHQWYGAAGGGDGAGMAEDLLAALDADEPRTPVRNLWAELS